MQDEIIELTAQQREHLAALIQQLNSTRLVAENFVSYFAKELGVNLQLYQFDAERVCFVRSYAPPNAAMDSQGLPEFAEAEPVYSNGHEAV